MSPNPLLSFTLYSHFLLCPPPTVSVVFFKVKTGGWYWSGQRRIVTFLIIAPYKYSYLLTYLHHVEKGGGLSRGTVRGDMFGEGASREMSRSRMFIAKRVQNSNTKQCKARHSRPGSATFARCHHQFFALF